MKKGMGTTFSAVNSERLLIQIQPSVVGLLIRARGRTQTFEQTMSLHARPGLLGEDLPEERGLV